MSCRVVLLMALLTLFYGISEPAFGASGGKVITWGANTREWNRQLGVDALRLGCSSAPATCVNDADHSARAQGVKSAYLSILLNAGNSPLDARVYSQLSLRDPVLYEVGFDDFVSQCERQKLPADALNTLLKDFARQLKSVNPNLHLGLTIYMDQLSSGSSFSLLNLNQEFRSQVDYIHLYPHYRKEAQPLSVVVEKAKQVFPNAKIIAGAYAYDRRDYLPCVRGGSGPCSNEEEVSLFRSLFEEQWAMLRSGVVTAIEFYPGSFGTEEEWSGWENPRSCRAGRRQECVANTRDMRRAVKDIVSGPQSPKEARGY